MCVHSCTHVRCLHSLKFTHLLDALKSSFMAELVRFYTKSSLEMNHGSKLHLQSVHGETLSFCLPSTGRN